MFLQVVWCQTLSGRVGCHFCVMTSHVLRCTRLAGMVIADVSSIQQGFPLLTVHSTRRTCPEIPVILGPIGFLTHHRLVTADSVSLVFKGVPAC